MIAFSVILFAVSALFLLLGILIRSGRTNLIHDYHQTKVKESEMRKYGKAFAKAMFCIAATMLTSGIIALFGEGAPILTAALTVLFLGLAVSFVMIGRVQKKFNGGIF